MEGNWKKFEFIGGAKTDIALFLLQDEEVQLHRISTVTAGGSGPNDIQRASQERKKQRLEAQGLAEVVTSRESLKMQLNVQNNPEHFLPAETSNHKPPNSISKGVEGVALTIDEDGLGFGRGRGGRGRGRGKGKGRGKVSKLSTASDIAKRILEAEKFVIEEPSQEVPNLIWTLKCKIMLQEDPLGGITHHLSLFSLKEVNTSA